MRTAEHMEHRNLERKWRPSFTARATSDWGSVDWWTIILGAERREISIDALNSIGQHSMGGILKSLNGTEVSGAQTTLIATNPVGVCDRKS